MMAFNYTLSIVASQTLALAAKRQLKEEKSIWYNKYLFISFLWMTIIYMPSAIAHYFACTAWDVGYLFNPFPSSENSPRFLASVICWVDGILLNAVFVGSFMLAHKWIRANKQRLIILFSASVALTLFIYLGVAYENNFIVTSFEEFQRLPKEGIKFVWGGNSFWGGKFFWVNVFFTFFDIGPLVFLYYWFHKEGKRLSALKI